MKKSYDVSVLNTICNGERQTEAESIAESVDAMIKLLEIKIVPILRN